MREGIDNEGNQADRELRFFSDNLNRLVKMSEIEELTEKEISVLVFEATAVYASLGGVIQDINARIDAGQEIECNWSRRVRTKALITKHFLEALKRERKNRSAAQRDKCFRALVMTVLGVKETNVLMNRAKEMTEEDRLLLSRQLKLEEGEQEK